MAYLLPRISTPVGKRTRRVRWTAAVGSKNDAAVEFRLSMVVLEVQDLVASVEFYRTLGLDIPDPPEERPEIVHRMGSGVSLLLTTRFASAYDKTWTRPSSGYQQMLEFSPAVKPSRRSDRRRRRRNTGAQTRSG